MLHKQHLTYSKLLVLGDVLTGFVSLIIGYYSRDYLVLMAPEEWAVRFNPLLLPLGDYLFYLLAALPAWLALLISTQRYSHIFRLPLLTQFFHVAQFAVSAGLLVGFFSYAFKLEVSRPIVLVFLLVFGLLLYLNRVVSHWILRSRNFNEHNHVKILIVGENGRAQAVAERLEAFRMWGYHVVGYLNSSPEQPDLPGVRKLGTLQDLPSLLSGETVFDEVIFVGSTADEVERFEELMRFCEDVGVRTRLAVDFFPASASRVSLEFLENLPLLTFSTAPDQDMALIAKRVLDFSCAVIALVVLAPILVLIGLAVRLTSPGPALYRQMRCGLYGRRFQLIKFRTMIDGAEDKLWEIKHLNEMDGPVFKMRNDPRVTPLGKFLRKSSLDELPQLWNVIKGEMSIVGPRAPVPEEVRYYKVKQRRRLSVKPGMTCLWQVSGRNDIDFHRWMEMDLLYIDRWSLWLDVRIMLRTIPAVFTGRGAR